MIRRRRLALCGSSEDGLEERLDFCDLIVRHFPLRGADVLMQLFRRHRAGDDGRYRRFREEPRESELEYRVAVALRECYE